MALKLTGLDIGTSAKLTLEHDNGNEVMFEFNRSDTIILSRKVNGVWYESSVLKGDFKFMNIRNICIFSHFVERYYYFMRDLDQQYVGELEFKFNYFCQR